MRNVFMCFIAIAALSCNYIWKKTVNGNGNIITQERNLSNASKIESSGDFDIEITEGSPAVKITTDENLMQYILTENHNGLEIKARKNINLRPTSKVKIIVFTHQLSAVQLLGSGNITGTSKFFGANRLKLSIAGAGNITLEINTPSVDADIMGSGNISLSGETKDEKINIAGVGDYKAENLKAENVSVHIAGSGNVRVYAAVNLHVDIAGSGDVYYKGAPHIQQSVAGSGSIKQIQ